MYESWSEYVSLINTSSFIGPHLPQTEWKAVVLVIVGGSANVELINDKSFIFCGIRW